MVPDAAVNAPQAQPYDGAGPGTRLGPTGRYELVSRIGTGGMGTVFRAKDHKLGCERAVKVLDAKYSRVPAFVERFRREAMAASRITHPNIVSVVDVASEGERPVYLVMELLEGRTLSQLVRGAGQLPWSQVAGYIEQLAAGLGAAHAQGVVHRDVKPGNCLVLADEQVKVLDFGIAKVTDMPAELVALTAAGEIIGTCSYMAPEQIRGQVDTRSDIYALGVLAFRMLAGRVPFVHEDQDKVLLAHLTEPAPRISTLVPSLPVGVDALLMRMLAKQPHQRFDSMEELRRALSEIDRGVVARPPIPTAERSPVAGRTVVFEDAPTRSVDMLDTPSPGSDDQESARPSINTAPAGSGALAQLEGGGEPTPVAERVDGTLQLDLGADGNEVNPRTPVGGTLALDAGLDFGGRSLAPRPMGTMVLDTEPEASGGRTLVVEDPSASKSSIRRTVPAPGPPGAGDSAAVAVVPQRMLGSLAAPANPTRVTRLAKSPVDEPAEGGVLRGVLSAAGGVALAAAVVAVWVMAMGSNSEAASEEPAAVPVNVVGGDQPEPEPDVVAAELDTKAEPDLQPQVTPEIEEPSAEDPVATPTPEPPKPVETRPTPRPRNTKKRRKSKPKPPEATAEPDVKLPEPAPREPEPQPDKQTKKRPPGDLRDPF